MKTKIDWEALNWTRSNIDLALITGYSRQAIQKTRKRLGKPAAEPSREGYSRNVRRRPSGRFGG